MEFRAGHELYRNGFPPSSAGNLTPWAAPDIGAFMTAIRDRINSKEYVIRREAWGCIVYDRRHDRVVALGSDVMAALQNDDPLDAKFPGVREVISENPWRWTRSPVFGNVVERGFSLSAPISSGWLVTPFCNLECKHCYGNEEEIGGTALDTESCQKIVDRMAATGLMRIDLSGGEPTVRKDIFSLLERARSHGLGVVLSTHGGLLNSEKVRRLRELGVFVSVNFISSDPDVHNGFMRSNAWEHSVGALRLLVAEGVPHRVFTAVSSSNEPTLEATADFLVDLGIEQWHLARVIHAGRAVQNWASIGPRDWPSTRDKLRQIQLAVADKMSICMVDSNTLDRYSFIVMPSGAINSQSLKEGRKIELGYVLRTDPLEIWNTPGNIDHWSHFGYWMTRDRVV